VRAVYAAWNRDWDVFQLVLKDNKKELNPKYLSRAEKTEFDKADQAEWRQWIMNGVVERVPPEVEKEIPAKFIITAPMRYVRTNKGKSQLEAKS